MNTRYGRGDRIRTCGLCVPNAALYQTEPRLDIQFFYNPNFTKNSCLWDFMWSLPFFRTTPKNCFTDKSAVVKGFDGQSDFACS